MPYYHYSPRSVYNSYIMTEVRLAKYMNNGVLIESYKILPKYRFVNLLLYY